MAEQQPQFSLDSSLYKPQPLPIPVGGVVNDIPPDQIQDTQLLTALNFVIRQGVLTQRPGYETLIGATAGLTSTPCSLVEFVPDNQSAMIIAGTLTGFAYSTGGAWTNITTTARTGSINQPVMFTTMQIASASFRLISVNGKDSPAWYTGATASAFVYMTTAVIGACVIAWRSHLLQGDCTTPTDGRIASQVCWSMLGAPTTWHNSSPTTASTGFVKLQDGNATRIMNLMPLNGQLLVYKEEGVHVLVYKGAPFYFTQFLLHGSLTCLSRRGIAPINNGDQHAVVTKESPLILWDGQNQQDVGFPIASNIRANLNWAARETVWVAYWPLTNEVLVAIPTGTNTRPNRVWIYNLIYKSWWETDLDFLAAQPIYNIWSPPKLLGAHPGPDKIYEIFSGYGDGTGATAISSSLSTKLYNFGSEHHKGLMELGVMANPGTGATTTFRVSRAATENPLQSLTFDTPQAITVAAGADRPRAAARITGPYLSFRLTHTTASETVVLERLIPTLIERTGERKAGR